MFKVEGQENVILFDLRADAIGLADEEIRLLPGVSAKIASGTAYPGSLMFETVAVIRIFLFVQSA